MQKLKNKKQTEAKEFKKGFILEETEQNGTKIVTPKEVEFKIVWYMYHTAEIKKTSYTCSRDIYEDETKAIAMAAWYNSTRKLEKTKRKWWQIWK